MWALGIMSRARNSASTCASGRLFFLCGWNRSLQIQRCCGLDHLCIRAQNTLAYSLVSGRAWSAMVRGPTDFVGFTVHLARLVDFVHFPQSTSPIRTIYVDHLDQGRVNVRKLLRINRLCRSAFSGRMWTECGPLPTGQRALRAATSHIMAGRTWSTYGTRGEMKQGGTELLFDRVPVSVLTVLAATPPGVAGVSSRPRPGSGRGRS
jgi:hypothetical protein